MNTLYSRIRERREALEMSQTELAEILGYSDRSTIAKIEKGVNDITQSKIEAFARALHTTPAYLMGWTTDWYDYDTDEEGRFDEIPSMQLEHLKKVYDGDLREVWNAWQAIQEDAYSESLHSPSRSAFASPEMLSIIKDYSSLDSHGKSLVKLVINAEKKRIVSEQRKKMDTAAELAGDIMDKSIPFRRSYQPASAGTGMYLGPDEFETIYVKENNLTRRASFGIPVSGDSMEPDYHDGDVLLVERAEDIRIGEVGVFTINGDGYVKERGDGELISLNPAYDPIPMNESIHCNGRVIGILKPDWIVEK